MMINSKFKLILVVISLCHISSQVASQSASCEYSVDEDNGYACTLTLTDADESTQITGQHLQGKSDNDVKFIETFSTNSDSTKIPNGLCEKFKNAVTIFLKKLKLEEIDENLLEKCSELKDLGLGQNKITKIAKNAFASQSKLKSLWLDNNQLTELDPDLFANLTSLTGLFLWKNQIQILPDGFFSSLINLEFLNLSKNQLTILNYSSFGDGVKTLKIFDFYVNNIDAIDERIFSNNPDLKFIRGYANQCTITASEVFLDFGDERPAINRYLGNCFSNYED